MSGRRISPNLMDCVELLKNRESIFRLSEITDEECLELTISILDKDTQRIGELGDIARTIEKNPSLTDSLRRYLAATFYRVGLVGLKLEAHDSVAWSTSGRRSVSVAEIDIDVRLSVHPCFWRCLGIRP